MTMPRLNLLALAAATVLMASAGLAAAADNSENNNLRRYCPPGSTLYTGILGAWCTDSTQAGVQPIECKSGSGQIPGTWNSAPVSAQTICNQPAGSSGQSLEAN